MTPSSFTRAYVAHDLGGDLHRLAQRAAVVAAALYVAGLAVGVVIHWANDWLSGDRRPWPVAWGVVDAPVRADAPLRALAKSIEPAWMTSPTWIAEKGGFIDLAPLTVDELRALAMDQGLRYTKGARPIRLASKSQLIAALQCTP
jgi:hypothetical protein